DDRFSRKAVGWAGLQAEHVARQVEGADLAASVGEQLVAADRARNDLIDIFRRLVLTIDFLVLLVGEFRGEESCHRGKLVGRGEGSERRFVGDNGRVVGLVEHEPSPGRRMANGYMRSRLW